MRPATHRQFNFPAERLALASLFGFGVVVLLLAGGATLGVDAYAQDAAGSWRQGTLRQIAQFATSLGGGSVLIVVAAIAAFSMIARRQFAQAVLPALVLAAAGAANQGIKCSFTRTRPSGDVWDSAVTVCDRYAFPSGHAMDSMALYSLLVLWVLSSGPPRERVPIAVGLGLVPLAAGLSRVALGVHWISDVAGGWMAGLLVMSLVVLVWDFAIRRIEAHRSPTPEERD